MNFPASARDSTEVRHSRLTKRGLQKRARCVPVFCFVNNLGSHGFWSWSITRSRNSVWVSCHALR
jgi:hypothetical protein